MWTLWRKGKSCRDSKLIPCLSSTIVTILTELPQHLEQDPGATYSVGLNKKKWILEVPTQLDPLQRNGFWRYLLSWVHYKKCILEVPTQLDPLKRNRSWRCVLSWIYYKETDPEGTYSVGPIKKKWILEVPTQLDPLQRNESWRYLLSWVHYKNGS